MSEDADGSENVTDAELVLYDVADGVATLTLNRPEVANAQNFPLLDLLDRLWTQAADDPDVKVIVLRGTGKHFSAGHDLADPQGHAQKWTSRSMYEMEAKRYLDYCLRWRNVPKPTIAAIQGACIAGALLLAWPCDLIIAADNAKFSDPVVAMGVGGVEYHGHTWELGPRLAKEILFTGRPITAEEAKAVGMVNRVVPADQLWTATNELAAQIAKADAFALRMAKRAVNQTLDVQGFTTAIQAVFDVHQLGHAHALTQVGWPILVDLEAMKKEVGSKG